MSAAQKLALARTRKAASRERLLATLASVQGELKPETLADKAVERFAGPAIVTGLEVAYKVRRRPRLAIGAVLIVVGLILAPPVTRVARRLHATRNAAGH